MNTTPVWAFAFLAACIARAPAQQPPVAPAAPPDPRAAVGEVVLANADGKNFASGTVFWITPDLAVTNWHVLRESHTAVIRMSGGREHRVTRMIGADERADAAVVRAEPRFEGSPLVLNAALPLPGEPVRMLTAESLFPQPILRGTVLRADEIEFYGVSLVIHTPRAGSPGWSGAPILNEEGRVIGVMRGAGPAAALGAPAAVIDSLRAAEGRPVEGVAFEAWDRTPTTRFGRSMDLWQRVCRLGLDKPAEHAALLREAVENSPDFWFGWGRLGEIALTLGQTDEAIDAYEHAAALSPEAHHGVSLAALYRARGRFEEADAARARAMRTDPVGFLFVTERNRALEDAKEGYWAESLPALERAVQGQPEDVELRVGLAQCLAFTGRPHEALRHLDYALRQHRDYMPGHYAKGVALTRLGRWADAVEPFKRAVALGPTSAPARAFLAEACARTGDDAEADAQLAALEAIDKPFAGEIRLHLQAIRSARRK